MEKREKRAARMPCSRRGRTQRAQRRRPREMQSHQAAARTARRGPWSISGEGTERECYRHGGGSVRRIRRRSGAVDEIRQLRRHSLEGSGRRCGMAGRARMPFDKLQAKAGFTVRLLPPRAQDTWQSRTTLSLATRALLRAVVGLCSAAPRSSLVPLWGGSGDAALIPRIRSPSMPSRRSSARTRS